ncbi:MAG: PRC-barrel domain-containing protein [Burkholderiales bacterium]|nr:PRC-barrel domain-containing protein [Burkholderiales bacterium]
MHPSSTKCGLISSSKVEGTSVYNWSGEKLGSIDDLVIDKWSGWVLAATYRNATE